MRAVATRITAVLRTRKSRETLRLRRREWTGSRVSRLRWSGLESPPPGVVPESGHPSMAALAPDHLRGPENTVTHWWTTSFLRSREHTRRAPRAICQLVQRCAIPPSSIVVVSPLPIDRYVAASATMIGHVIP
jgi:hypothetical protein